MPSFLTGKYPKSSNGSKKWQKPQSTGDPTACVDLAHETYPKQDRERTSAYNENVTYTKMGILVQSHFFQQFPGYLVWQMSSCLPQFGTQKVGTHCTPVLKWARSL
jgi:hypothetical protein